MIRPNQTGFVEGRSILDNTFLAQEVQKWAEESNKDLVLLLLDFEKAFDKIEWSFLFEALAKLGFCPRWIRWVSSLYTSASSTIKLNGVEGSSFPLARSVRQGCPLLPYLFILVTDVLGHMLDDLRFRVEGLTLPGGRKIRDQTFVGDTALYLQGTCENMERTHNVLDIFRKASGAKVNWNKTAAIWASKNEKDWDWGQEVGLEWVSEGKGVRYLGIQVGFHLPPKANFSKMVTALKGKLINWSTCRFSLAGRILVANQVLLASMWYMAAAWNPSPAMCNLIQGIMRNFIWSGKASNARAKVKWETLVLPTAHGGLGIIDPKAQSKALLAKLFIRGLAPGGEPWKELLRHKANQVKLPVHDLGPSTQDINWMFATTKLKRPPISLWKSILHASMSVRPGLCKSEPTNSIEILRQPVFGNPLIVNQESKPLGLSDRNEGNCLVNAGCSRVRDFWDSEEKDWKGLSALGVSFHPANKRNRDLIIASIPWDPATSNNVPLAGEWISKKEARQTGPPQWVYQVVGTTQSTANVSEFKRISHTGRIKATGSHTITIPLEGYEPIRVLTQDNHGATFRLAKNLPLPSKKPLFYWILGSGFISDLQRDPGDWHWQQTRNMGDAPFFGYSSKRGYQNARKPHRPPGIIDFIQRLSLRNSTQGRGPHLVDPQQRAPNGHVAPNHGAPSHLQRLRSGPP